MENKNISTLDLKCINTIRFLAVDEVQAANSGHPGMPLGAAAIAFTIWDRFLKHNPVNPDWADRDRFILSAGHASAMLYALLHLTGHDLPMDQLKRFRQWGSMTPGHPERGVTPGVEMTSGPLGQGFSHAVGMALAEKILASRYNEPGFEIVDHYTYVLASDGDIEEGIVSEAASLASTWKLGKLIVLYDKNGIQIEGSTEKVMTEDVGARFRAYGWHVIDSVDGMSPRDVAAAISEARKETANPSLVICKTVIGYGSPWEGTAKVHGSPLGVEGVIDAKKKAGWPAEPSFLVPEDVREHMGKAVEKGKAAERVWSDKLRRFAEKYPEKAESFKRVIKGDLPAIHEMSASDLLKKADVDRMKPIATRAVSGKVLNVLAPETELLVGGSADLAPSNNTEMKGVGDFSALEPTGRNLHFGVREHSMAAISGGIAIHGGFIPYAATFLTFSDYMRPSIRLAAMMGLQVIYIFTHDSIGVGEDGPTHQPVEHTMSLRAIPGLTVIRPSDPMETAEAWLAALENTNGPTALILTRQKVQPVERTGSRWKMQPENYVKAGGYILWESETTEKPDIIFIATGSEVGIAVKVASILAEKDDFNTRVVSIPSWEIFLTQSADYRNFVLPPEVTQRVSVEAGITIGWERFTGTDGLTVGLDRFGASAPFDVVYEKLGFTPESIAERVRKKYKQPL